MTLAKAMVRSGMGFNVSASRRAGLSFIFKNNLLDQTADSCVTEWEQSTFLRK
jgi:hypothetical protein